MDSASPLSDTEPTRPVSDMDRREFLSKVVAGSLTLGFAISGADLIARTVTPSTSFVDWSPNVFISLSTAGILTITAHRSEMGTGISTSLPMVVADEMEADWERVQIVQAVGDQKYGSQNTDGSRSMRNFMNRMRQAGAIARQMLETTAAKLWKVPVAECKADLHNVIHAATGRRLGYGQLADAAAKLSIPKANQVTLKKPSEWRYIGKGKPIHNMSAILYGNAMFGLDVQLSGMKVAVIARSPVLGGVAQKWDADAAMAVPGVEKIIHLPAIEAPYVFKPLGGIAVIAKDTWSALKGREKLNVQWDDGPHAVFDSETQREELRKSATEAGNVVRKNGEVETEFAKAEQRISATYDLPHLAHVPMETPCATARITEAGAEIWMPTQTPQSAQASIASALKLRPNQVTVHVTLLGGGFGRKSKPDYGVEAALLAKAAGSPVQVLWTREDDIQHDYFHAVSTTHFEATLQPDGRPSAWLQRSAFTPIGYTFNPATRHGGGGEMGQGFTDLAFDLPNLQVENGPADAHVRIGWLRSVANIYHAFGIGCFADECAAAAGQDPLDYLLSLIGEPRHIDLKSMGVSYGNYGAPIEDHPIDTGRLRAVVEQAAAMSRWKENPLPPFSKQKGPLRRGRGIAVHRSFLGYVANVVEVEIDHTGHLIIKQVDVALDCGLAVHPDRVRSQMEGAVIFGISLARFGEITAKKGRIQQSNFHDFPVARNVDSPEQINIHIIPSDGLPTGVGEVGVPPFAPALLNAIFAATGKRIRSLPLKNHNLVS